MTDCVRSQQEFSPELEYVGDPVEPSPVPSVDNQRNTSPPTPPLSSPQGVPSHTPSPHNESHTVHHPFSQPSLPLRKFSQVGYQTHVSQLEIPQEPTPPTSEHPYSPELLQPVLLDETPTAHPKSPLPHEDSSDDASDHELPVIGKRQKLQRRRLEQDFFVSASQTTQSPASGSVHPRAREPPMLIEGAFNRVFTTPSGRVTTNKKRRRVSGIMEEEEEDSEVEGAQKNGIVAMAQGATEAWPPKRRRDKGTGRASTLR